MRVKVKVDIDIEKAPHWGYYATLRVADQKHVAHGPSPSEAVMHAAMKWYSDGSEVFPDGR